MVVTVVARFAVADLSRQEVLEAETDRRCLCGDGMRCSAVG